MSDFWEEEYASGSLSQNENFDWFLDFDDFPGGGRDWFTKACGGRLGQGSKILVIGCGHASLSSKLQREAFTEARIISIDSSPTCIERMRKIEPDMEYYLADACNLQATLPNTLNQSESYDAVIDKGCLDAILAYSQDGIKKSQGCIQEVRNLLKTTGRFILISCTREHDPAQNLDGYQGGRPTCLQFFTQAGEEVWRILDRQDTLPAPRSQCTQKKNRPLSPLHPDVIPQTYSALILQRQPPWADYAAYYRGDYDPSKEIPAPHDAFVSFSVLQPFFKRWCFLNEKIKSPYFLEVGCGNSPLASELLLQFPNIKYLGTDVVPEAIDQQRIRHPQLDLRVADARFLVRDLQQNNNTNQESCSFDVVFDKGTADALFLYDNADSGTDHHVQLYLRGLTRILHPDHGVFLVAACARQDGILQGSKAPRIWTNVAQPAGWHLLAHHHLQSDVGAGDERTFDFLALRPPSFSSFLSDS